MYAPVTSMYCPYFCGVWYNSSVVIVFVALLGK